MTFTGKSVLVTGGTGFLGRAIVERLLDALGHASSKAEGGEKESRERLGWEQIPSSAPAYEPLPPRS